MPWPMSRGARGDQVRALQQALNSRRQAAASVRLFGELPPLEVDGAFGPKTEAAVGQAQMMAGLEVTGQVDASFAAGLGLAVPSVEGRPAWLEVDHRFKGSKRRGGVVNAIVLHETVTDDDERALKVLAHRRLSTHYTVHHGRVLEVCDPERRCAHAGNWNDTSIGIDVSNRYYGKAGEGERLIKAPWADRRSYRVQPPEEYEATWVLVDWLCTTYDIPRVWLGVEVDNGTARFRWRTRPATQRGPVPGITSHHRVSTHADAMTQEFYCYLRQAGIEPDAAFRLMVTDAQAGGVSSVPRV